MSSEKEKADAFVSDLRAVVEKHFGKIEATEVEPLGMQLRQVLPAVSYDTTANITTTTTVTVYPSLDTDPADSD